MTSMRCDENVFSFDIPVLDLHAMMQPMKMKKGNSLGYL